jgi:hypothetical protein
MAPILFMGCLLLAAMVCLVAGVHVLAGPGWALVATAACFIAAAGVISRGQRRLNEVNDA